MNRKDIRARILATGIVASVRVPSAEDARFAAETVADAGIPVVEIALTVPGALEVISELADCPGVIVGAGSVLNGEMARCCIDAGAKFLTTDGFIPEVVEATNENQTAVLPGALTPTEVITAWRAGSDLVKVVPVAAVGGENYIKALVAPLPQIPLIAAGGVNQQTAAAYLAAGSAALGIGQALLPWEAIALRQSSRIRELARRFLNIVAASRREDASRFTEPAWATAATITKETAVCEPI
jgi:2-dehydro-3-deoxyphosphogluconate aldolase / (4S)-4-hydroxy-2-oxoglutarate aldolase